MSVSQQTDPISQYRPEERTIMVDGEPVILGINSEAPWLSWAGACLVKVYGFRRVDGAVEFGIGNENPPIIAWVKADAFFHEWPQ